MTHPETGTSLDMSSAPAKRAAYALLQAQAASLFAGERDWLANLAQFAALIYNALPDLNWAGFYLARNEELILGPFQGKVACVRIPFSRGGCGACARTLEIQLVSDVHAFAGHIACDAASRSELVLPVLVDGQLRAVFDLDSPLPARFDGDDAQGLSAALALLVQATDWDTRPENKA
ncbi:GAF domain-containing protein [Rhodocyclus tenuis]|uniref:GAF domain-containing protein n=1 Tax=Rhodocyclus tenuis TaxID=1066 RepID=UPI001906B600|nr:GAF domain-containing protein [Rhodocyclus tenuis]